MRRFALTDLPEVERWYAERRMLPLDERALSGTGFIEPNVAAGWLYGTDSTICFLDGYVSNPHSDPSVRDRALDEITRALVAAAKAAGYRQVIAYTKSSSVGRRAQRHNFVALGSRSCFGRVI